MHTVWGTRVGDWTRKHWPLVRKVAIGCFVVGVLVLLGVAVEKIQWGKVIEAIRGMPASVIATALSITALSYLVYSSFDLLGKWYTGHSLKWPRTLLIGFVSYAFTMTMGAPVGGLGLRLRLYTRQGTDQATVMRVLALSLVTNWVGYSLLAGCLFAMGTVRLPAQWGLNGLMLRILGGVLILAGAGYLAACAFSRKRTWRVHGHEIELPSIGMALVQVSLAILNWALIGATIYVLFQGQADYLDVLAILLVSAVAGALAHIPGGLGVIESIFITFLDGALPESAVLGTLLVYRAVYYLFPLLVAGLIYLATETKWEISDNLKS